MNTKPIMMVSKKTDWKIPTLSGSHRMTWRELVEADDYATTLIVDPFLGFKTHKMTDMRLRISSRVSTRLRNIIREFQQHKDYQRAFTELIGEDVNIKQHWKDDPRFRDHFFRYLLLFDERSGIEIVPCNRYASEGHVGGAIFSTKKWHKGSKISSLIGCIAELDHKDEVSFLRHKQNDFSVMYSSRKNKSQLWLGPAAYVNHDCRPNCAFTINCDGDDRMSLTATEDIEAGDQIYIYYGKHFFDTNNAACECFTCELLGLGSFSSFGTTRVEATGSPSTSSITSMAAAPAAGDPHFGIGAASSTTSSYSSSSSNALEATIRERLREVSGPQRVQRASMPTLRSHRRSLLSPDPVTPPTPSTSIVSASAISGDPPTKTAAAAAAMRGLLVKGLSTGLAQQAGGNNYSLRHTNSRLTRVKAKIYSAMLSTFHDGQEGKAEGLERRRTLTPSQRRQAAPTRHSLPPTRPARRSVPRRQQQAHRQQKPRRSRAARQSDSTVEVEEEDNYVVIVESPARSQEPDSLSTTSSKQTPPMTFPEEAVAYEMPIRLRRIFSPKTNSHYYLRRSDPKPIEIDLSKESEDEVQSSACSTVSTLPASMEPSHRRRFTAVTTTPPRLVLARRRSKQEDASSSSSSTVEATAPDLWFIKDLNENPSVSSLANTPSPPELQSEESDHFHWTLFNPPDHAAATKVFVVEKEQTAKPLKLKITRVKRPLSYIK